MKTLLKNGTVVNVFTDSLERADVLLEGGRILGVGDYQDADADTVEDVAGKYICPGFIDGHIHIESTMMTPAEFAKAVLPHGTTAVVADPHEIANVCGIDGIRYMLEASEGLPLTVYVMLPSCVPATPFDESGAVLTAQDLRPLYEAGRVLGLAEMMNYPGVLAGDADVLMKIADAHRAGKVVDGHAPLLTGRELDVYLSTGIQSDHECSSYEEAIERIRKGQWLMIRQGTAARNLEGLIGLFDEPWNHRCLLVTDDRHPADLLGDGHIDHIIRQAVRLGKSPLTAIRMATIQAAECFHMHGAGAVAPGFRSDLLVLDDLDTVAVRDVYCGGVKVVCGGQTAPVAAPAVSEQRRLAVAASCHLDRLRAEDFHIQEKGEKCRVIKTVPGQLLTDEWITEIDWANRNGVDLGRDILKIAVIERHRRTGHKGLGFISGLGLGRGAIASTVSHDSHNLIVVGANDEDMACVANHVIAMGGGYAAACDGQILADLPLPVAGLMSELDAAEIASRNEKLLETVASLGVPADTAPLMTMAFVSLAVIPSLKLTTKGLVDVVRQQPVELYV